MHHRTAIAIAVAFLLFPAASHGQTTGPADTLSAEPVVSPGDSSSNISLGMLMLMMDDRMRSATTLSFYSSPEYNMRLLLGYETYRAPAYQCALRGAGAGMSLGMAAGAFGMMTGAWDERRAWYVAGAAAAAGALLGTVKSDDPEWNIRIRWDPDR